MIGPIKPTNTLAGLDDFILRYEAEIYSESGDMYGPVYDYAYMTIQRAKLFAKGGSATGAPSNSLEAYAGMIENARHLRFPWLLGQRVVRFNPLPKLRVGGQVSNRFEIGAVHDKTRNEDRQGALPINPDIWYLVVGETILPSLGEGAGEKTETILEILAAYLEKLDNIKPLQGIRTKEEFEYVEVSTVDVIRTMRFETWTCYEDSAVNTEFPSKGPVTIRPVGATAPPNEMLGRIYAGFISFPAGPPGVMEVLSIYSEGMIDLAKDYPLIQDGTIRVDWPDDWRCVTTQTLDGLMSPMTDVRGKCPGVHIVEKGSVIMSGDTEYPASRMADYVYNQEHHDIRYWLRKDARWPTPGEFIGLLAKPYPNHVWWYQESSPLLYSGNWFETNYYTSGIVTEILPPLEGAIGNAYKCLVRGFEVCIASSDFYAYSIGERVAILRIDDLDRSLGTKGTYKWWEMQDLYAREKAMEENPTGLDYDLHTGLRILPISFYEIDAATEEAAIANATTLAANKADSDEQSHNDGLTRLAESTQKRAEMVSRIGTARSNAISQIIAAFSAVRNVG